MAGGRPTKYTKELVDVICERLADGEGLIGICEDEAMPDRSTVFRWLEVREEFRDKYARAREAQADYYADEIVDVSKNRALDLPLDNGKGGYTPDTTAVQRDRLIIDALKWKASKLAPKKYGEKVQQEITGAEGAALIPSITVNVKGQE